MVSVARPSWRTSAHAASRISRRVASARSARRSRLSATDIVRRYELSQALSRMLGPCRTLEQGGDRGRATSVQVSGCRIRSLDQSPQLLEGLGPAISVEYEPLS